VQGRIIERIAGDDLFLVIRATGPETGGIVVGIIEALVTAYISSSLANAVVFLILIVMLLVKPAGILGKNVGEKV